MPIKADQLKEKEDYQKLILEYLNKQNGYIVRDAKFHYDPSFAMDKGLLIAFLDATQSEKMEKLRKFHKDKAEAIIIAKINEEINRKTRGLIDVLKNGVDMDNNITLSVMAKKPATSFNKTLTAAYEANTLSVIEEVYHKDGERIDLVIFLNGLAIFAIELKCNTSGQTVDDAIKQFKTTRDPNTRLLKPKVGVIASFAMDLREVYMTAELKCKDTYFRPFNKGNNGGKGNPANSDGLDVDYMWKDIFTKDKIALIIEHFACIVKEDKKDKKTSKKVQVEKALFPRYHQLKAIEKVIAHARENRTDCNYLIQHSAGSGKTNTIAWLAHSLVSLHDENDEVIYNTVLIITDRIVVDRQLQDAVQAIQHKSGLIKTLDDKSHAADLATALNGNTKIIVTTIHKFFHILGKGLLQANKEKKFAVLIDEAHSSTEGTLMEAVTAVLADGSDAEDEKTTEDKITEEISRIGKQANVSMFAFTATPKPETIALFGTTDDDGKKKAFDLYSMKQAIEEGYILNVLDNYVTWKTYYEINKIVDEDPELQSITAKRKITRFVDLHDTNIRQKTEIIIEHFRHNIARELAGTAKAMVVTSGRAQAVKYYFQFKDYIASRGYKDVTALVAFSGTEKESGLTERMINGISEECLREEFNKDDFQILLVANKYQTGFDQPKLCAMYVDKKLHGIAAVQTLSRLNRIYPPYDKRTFILDFKNDYGTIKEAFAPYYEHTFLDASISKSDIREFLRKFDEYDFLEEDDITEFNELTYKDSRTSRDKEKMWALLNKALNKIYDKKADGKPNLTLQIEIRSNIRKFLKAYQFLIQTTCFEDVEMHKTYNFLAYLSKEIDLSGGGNDFDIADKITVSNFKQIEGEKNGGEVEPKPDVKVSKKPSSVVEQQKKLLSQIIEEMNALYGKSYEGESTIKSMLQIKDLLLANARLKNSAKNNKLTDFRFAYDDIVEEALVAGWEQNQDFYSTLLSNDELRQKVASVFMGEVYEILRSNK
jgi:type I restriction enzyme R subunit